MIKKLRRKGLLSDWEEIRKKGKVRFMLTFPLTYSFFYSCLKYFLGQKNFIESIILFIVLFFTVGGSSFIYWYFSEKKYEKLKLELNQSLSE